MDLQVHILNQLVNEVELVRVVSCQCIFFLERFMKKVKGFFLQRVNPEGYMEKGYIIYELFYYVSEYIKQIDHTPGVVIWDDERDEHKRKGEVLE